MMVSNPSNASIGEPTLNILVLTVSNTFAQFLSLEIQSESPASSISLNAHGLDDYCSILCFNRKMEIATENMTVLASSSVPEDQIDKAFNYSLTTRQIEQSPCILESSECHAPTEDFHCPTSEQPEIYPTVSLQESPIDNSHLSLQLNAGSVHGTLATLAMARTNSKPPKPDNKKPPHKILYPTRASIPNDSSSSKAIKWRGLDPLAMVQHISELALAFSHSSDSSNFDEFREERAFLRKFVHGEVSTDNGTPNHSHKNLSDITAETCSTAIEDIHGLNALETFTPSNPKSILDILQIPEESLNELDENDLATKGASIPDLIARLEGLISDFEDLGVGKDMFPSYNRVIMLLNAAFHRREGSADPKVTSNDAKNAVTQAIDQVKTLMVMAKFEQSEMKAKHNSGDELKYASRSKLLSDFPRLVATINDHQEQCHDSPIPTNVDWESMMYYGLPPKRLNQTFNEQMNLWLRCNWANPFPDTEMLNHLVSHLITSGCMTLPKEKADLLTNGHSEDYHDSMMKLATEKVTNWLVNARTRKWRPSIQEAFDLKRPTFMLLEDSISIFEGRPLMTIPGWDGDSFYSGFADFSAPLHTWYNLKKRPKKSFSTKKRTNCIKNDDNSEKQVRSTPDTASLCAVQAQKSLREVGPNNVDDSSIPTQPLPAMPSLENPIGASFDLEFLEAIADPDLCHTFPV